MAVLPNSELYQNISNLAHLLAKIEINTAMSERDKMLLLRKSLAEFFADKNNKQEIIDIAPSSLKTLLSDQKLSTEDIQLNTSVLLSSLLGEISEGVEKFLKDNILHELNILKDYFIFSLRSYPITEELTNGQIRLEELFIQNITALELAAQYDDFAGLLDKADGVRANIQQYCDQVWEMTRQLSRAELLERPSLLHLSTTRTAGLNNKIDGTRTVSNFAAYQYFLRRSNAALIKPIITRLTHLKRNIEAAFAENAQNEHLKSIMIGTLGKTAGQLQTELIDLFNACINAAQREPFFIAFAQAAQNLVNQAETLFEALWEFLLENRPEPRTQDEHCDQDNISQHETDYNPDYEASINLAMRVEGNDFQILRGLINASNALQSEGSWHSLATNMATLTNANLGQEDDNDSQISSSNDSVKIPILHHYQNQSAAEEEMDLDTSLLWEEDHGSRNVL